MALLQTACLVSRGLLSAQALRDVELDWYKVLGYRAVIYANTSWCAQAKAPHIFACGFVWKHAS